MAHFLALPDAVLAKIFRELGQLLRDSHGQPPATGPEEHYIQCWAVGSVHIVDIRRDILLAGSTCRSCRRFRESAWSTLPTREWSSISAKLVVNSSPHQNICTPRPCRIGSATLVELGANFNRRSNWHYRGPEEFQDWPRYIEKAISVLDLHIDCARSLTAAAFPAVLFPKARLNRLSLAFEGGIDQSSMAFMRQIFARAGVVRCGSILLEPSCHLTSSDTWLGFWSGVWEDLAPDVLSHSQPSQGPFLQTSMLSINLRKTGRNPGLRVVLWDKLWEMLSPPWPSRVYIMAGDQFGCALYGPRSPQVAAVRYLCIDAADSVHALAQFTENQLHHFHALEHLKLVWRFCPINVRVAPSVKQIDLQLTFRFPFQKACKGIRTWTMPGVKNIDLILPWSLEEEPTDVRVRRAWQKAACIDREFAGQLEELLEAKGIQIEPDNLAYRWDMKIGRHLSPASRSFIYCEDSADDNALHGGVSSGSHSASYSDSE